MTTHVDAYIGEHLRAPGSEPVTTGRGRA